MGRTERLHPRQAEIDRILLENTGKGSYETVLRLLGEAGIDPVDLSVSGQSIPDSARISKVKDEAKRRASKRASRPKLVELAEVANALALEVQEAERVLAERRERWEEAVAVLVEESRRLGS